MNSTDQVFPSGVASWAAVMIWGICLSIWGTGLWILIDAGPNLEGFVAAGLCLLFGAGPLGFVYRTRYIITLRELIIQSGALRKRIQLDRIGNVTSKLTPGVNFAMSRENILQVNVRGSKLGYRISPADRDGFIRALAQACPHLEHVGGQLVIREGR
jgi:hypothetical protein